MGFSNFKFHITLKIYSRTVTYLSKARDKREDRKKPGGEFGVYVFILDKNKLNMLKEIADVEHSLFCISTA